jgi:surface protein
MLLVTLASIAVALISSGPTAQANTYTYSGTGGTLANTNQLVIDYIWTTDGDRVNINLEMPQGLEAVWINQASSESFTMVVTDSATAITAVRAPANSWSSGVKVRLVVRDRGSTSSPNLGGIRRVDTELSNTRMFEVISLGNFPGFTKLINAFSGSGAQLKISAQLPSTVNDLSYAFAQSSFNGDLSGWDTSRVSNFKQTFADASEFNQPLSSWDVRSATSMELMFAGASNFNQNLSSWNVSKVTTMHRMFLMASRFNNGDQTTSATVSGISPLTWSTSSVSDISYMFYGAGVFNQAIDSWDVSRVTTFESMFYNSSRFNNGDPQGSFENDTFSTNVTMSWSPSSATSFRSMFYSALSFNQNLNSWDVSKGQDFQSTFHLAGRFNNGDSSSAHSGNASLSSVTLSWSPSAATTFKNMFVGASAFNQNLSGWKTSNVSSMDGTFFSATRFNNGHAAGVGGTMPWSISQTPETNMLTDTFAGATSFNQDLNAWNVSKITSFLRTFNNASSFNNGDPHGAYEGDANGSDVRMLWNVSSANNLANTFQGAIKFNQNVSSWSVSKVTNMSYTFGDSNDTKGVFNNGASSTSSNVMAWSTSALTNLNGTFASLDFFNADVSSWNTSKVTTFVQTFLRARAFNQPIGLWTVSSGTTLNTMLSGARSLNQDLSSWGKFRTAANLSSLFSAGAFAMNDSPKNWDVTGVTNFQSLFGEDSIATASAIPMQNVRSIIGAWSLQRVQNTMTIGWFRGPAYTNCREWSAFDRLDTTYAWSFTGAAGAFPTKPTCNSVTVTWSPTTAPSFAASNYTPDSPATTNGPSGVKYAVHHAGSTSCRVNADTGVISYSTSGSCQIIAYDADTHSDTANVAGYEIVTFNLPTPSPFSTPGAPTISAAVAGNAQIGLTFRAPASDGGVAISRYEVGYSLTQGGSTNWVSASGVVTSSPTMSYTLSGLVSGTSYWLKVRAVNSIGVGAASNEFGPITPATTPSAPAIASTVFGNTQVTLNLTAPLTDGGSPLTTYEYRYATSSAGVASAGWTSSANTSTTITVSGLVNGTSYFFQVRAVNGVGASSATAVSSAITPITTSSPPIILFSTKLGSQASGEIQFSAPLETGGSAILDYQIRMSTDEGDNWSSWSDQAVTYYANVQRWGSAVSGLQGSVANPVFYTFELRARNAAGYSAPSLFVPSDLSITSVQFSNQQAVLTFNAAKYSGNLPILGYEYRYVTGTVLNPTTSSGWISISQSVWSTATTTTTTSFTVSGLTNGVSHAFSIRAVNALGGNENLSWLSPGVPNKPLASISFSYSVSMVAFSPNASFSPTVTSNSLGDLTFSTTTPSKCSVASLSGVVSNLNAGLCTIQLSQAESSTYSAATVLRSINTTMVNQPTLQISASSTTSPYRGTVTLTSSGGGGTGTVTFTAAGGSACVVSGNVVTVGNAGSACTVIATKASDGNYHAATSAQINIATTKIAQSALSFSNVAEMQALSRLTILANGGTGDGLVRYRISNAGTTGCTLSGTTLSAPSAGQCTVEASRATSTNYLQSASVSQVIEVVKAAQTVRFTSTVPAQPLVGDVYSVSATASSGLSVSFSVSGVGCSIAGNTVTFTSAGDCSVTASQSGSVAYLASPIASQTIAVGRRNHTLEFSTVSQNITSKIFGDTAFLIRATSTDPSAEVSYTVSPETTNAACSVLSSGLVFVLRVGDCVIQAYSAETTALAAASTVSHRIAVLSDDASAPFITSVAMGNLSITAGFTPPSYTGGTSISAYTIVAVDQSSTNSVDVSDSSCGVSLVGGQLSCRITGLENGKSYKIKVAAINSAGIGEYSQLSPAITVATNPAAVQNLRVIQGASTLVISWDDPDTLGGGTFLEYRIYVKRSASSSYVVSHPFRVLSATTQSVTISAETPPDGLNHPGGPALVNGVAYDIKIVTVTSVNQTELTGNTAVMNQIPRTVPDPPRLASALVVGNKLALTWTAPMSDGGAAVTSYSATVGNSPCVFNTVSETYCEIALPTTPGDYVFSIAAQNVAGSSAELQGVYTVVAPLSRPVTQLPGGVVSPPTGGGGIVIGEPAKPSESAPVVSSVNFSPTTKRLINIRGMHFRGVDKVVIGGLTARIISQTTEMIVVETPALNSGAHSVLIHLVDGDVLRHSKNLLVVGKPVVVQPKAIQVVGFRPGSSILSAAMKSVIDKSLRGNKNSKSLQCVGHTQGPTILKSDARLAMKRSKAVCAYAKKQGFKTVFSSYQNNTKIGSSFRRVDLFFTK